MAFTFKSKRQGYDNIAIGQASGKESIVVVGGDGEGETTRLTLSQRGTSTSALSQGLPERWIRSGTSDDEHVGKPTSDTIPAANYTSATTDTSNFMERLG